MISWKSFTQFSVNEHKKCPALKTPETQINLIDYSPLSEVGVESLVHWLLSCAWT